jgi:hypothetical protein
VTVLQGANDACTSTEPAVTPAATFRAQLEQAMTTLSTGLPSASIFVARVPDIRRLWQSADRARRAPDVIDRRRPPVDAREPAVECTGRRRPP